MAAGRRRWPIAIAVPLALAAAVGLLAQRAVVTVTGADGRLVAARVLPAPGRFELRYRHSYYRAEAAEWFVAGPDGGFRLVAVGSPSQAVLDYYDLAGADPPRGRLAAAGAAAAATLRAAAVGGHRARPAHPCRRRSSGTADAPRRRASPPDDRRGAAPVAAHPAGRPWPMTSHGPGNDTRTAARLPAGPASGPRALWLAGGWPMSICLRASRSSANDGRGQ